MRWVEPIPSGQDDQRRRDPRAREGDDVEHDVQVGGSDVQALVLRASEQDGDRNADENSGERDPADGLGANLGRVDEPADALHEDPDGEACQDGAVRLRRQDLGALEAERVAAPRRFRSSPRREQCRPSATASVSMCPASASSASEPATAPATTSAAMVASTSPSETARMRTSRMPRSPCEWPCPGRSWPTWPCARPRCSCPSVICFPNRALEQGCHLARLGAHVVLLRGTPRGHVRGRQLGGSAEAVRDPSPRSAGRRGRPPRESRTRAGRRPASRRRCARSPSPRESPARTARRGWAGRARRTPRSSRRRVGAERGRRGESPSPPRELREQGAVTDQRQLPVAEALARGSEAQRVLPLVERAHEEETRPLAVPADGTPRFLGIAPAKAFEVDAAVDDFDLAVELRQLGEKLPAQVVRDRDHRAGAPARCAGRLPHPPGWPRCCGRPVRAPSPPAAPARRSTRARRALRPARGNARRRRPAGTARPHGRRRRPGAHTSSATRRGDRSQPAGARGPARSARARARRRRCRDPGRPGPDTSARRARCASAGLSLAESGGPAVAASEFRPPLRPSGPKKTSVSLPMPAHRTHWIAFAVVARGLAADQATKAIVRHRSTWERAHRRPVLHPPRPQQRHPRRAPAGCRPIAVASARPWPARRLRPAPAQPGVAIGDRFGAPAREAPRQPRRPAATRLRHRFRRPGLGRRLQRRRPVRHAGPPHVLLGHLWQRRSAADPAEPRADTQPGD